MMIKWRTYQFACRDFLLVKQLGVQSYLDHLIAIIRGCTEFPSGVAPSLVLASAGVVWLFRVLFRAFLLLPLFILVGLFSLSSFTCLGCSLLGFLAGLGLCGSLRAFSSLWGVQSSSWSCWPYLLCILYSQEFCSQTFLLIYNFIFP